METKVQLASNVHYNLPVSALIEKSLLRNEAVQTATGALQVFTGNFTGRSPKDKYVVNEPSVSEHIAWGNVNQPLSQEHFQQLYQKAKRYMEERELFVFDGFAGADPQYRLPIRVVNEYAWHNLFARQLFIRPTQDELAAHVPEFNVIALPGLKADPEIDGTHSETFICISFEEKVVLIGGTEYAGEMKKSIFSVLNYILPFKGVLPMHCSANVGEGGDTSLFFGLSGTGKTTLSADPDRSLIGDDEHGWSEQGIFNFEGGCYAKCIGLSEEKEPQIWQAIRYGTLLENVVLDAATGVPDYNDNRITENTRAAYPIENIPGAVHTFYGRPSECDSFSDGRRLRRSSPNLEAYQGASDVSLPVRVYIKAGRYGERGHRTGVNILRLLRRSVSAAPAFRICGNAGQQNRAVPG